LPGGMEGVPADWRRQDLLHAKLVARGPCSRANFGEVDAPLNLPLEGRSKSEDAEGGRRFREGAATERVFPPPEIAIASLGDFDLPSRGRLIAIHAPRNLLCGFGLVTG
jgi:hypothetical protein